VRLARLRSLLLSPGSVALTAARPQAISTHEDQAASSEALSSPHSRSEQRTATVAAGEEKEKQRRGSFHLFDMFGTSRKPESEVRGWLVPLSPD
jgi:hypothetical protein